MQRSGFAEQGGTGQRALAEKGSRREREEERRRHIACATAEGRPQWQERAQGSPLGLGGAALLRPYAQGRARSEQLRVTARRARAAARSAAGGRRRSRRRRAARLVGSLVLAAADVQEPP